MLEEFLQAFAAAGFALCPALITLLRKSEGEWRRATEDYCFFGILLSGIAGSIWVIFYLAQAFGY